MADHIYTATIAGNTLTELSRNARMMADALNTEIPSAAAAPPPADEDDEDAQPEVASQPVVAPRRGRPPKSASAPAAAPAGANGAGAEKSVDEMRQEATDILKACWGKKNSPGAEKVIALQKKFGVSRFGEVGDDKVPSLLQAAVALQKELAGGGADADTGPF